MSVEERSSSPATEGGGQAGLSLIELLVALLVLGIVLTGVVSVAITTLGITLINDQRSVGTNLAQAEIERVRALSFDQLQAQLGDAEPRLVSTEGGDYEVRRFSEWASIDADTDPCAEPEASTVTAVIRIDVEVLPVDNPDHVTTSTTTVARPPATPAADVGALNVRVFDHQQPAQGVPSATVQLIGPEPSGEVRLQTTPPEGCVLFANIPTGNYEVRVERFGYVTARPGPDASAPVVAAGVSSGQRTVVEVPYAPEGGLTVVGDTTPLGANPIALPDPLPVTISRDGFPASGTAGQVIEPIWPGTWDVWAGDCRYADPQAITPSEDPAWPGAVRQDPAVVVPGPSLQQATARVGRVRVNAVAPGAGNPSTIAATVTATALSPCDNGTPVLSFPTAFPITGTIDLGLPYGTWRLDLVAGARTGSVQVTVDPRATAPLTVPGNVPLTVGG